MLQCFYARAMHSRNPKNKFRDTKAEELIDRIDYDFSNAKKDTAMSGGIVARSVVFDELVSDFIRKNPDCTVVNIACGLDPRCYRMTGFSHWYNLDLPETMAVREKLLPEKNETISQLAMSAMDDWGAKIAETNVPALIIIEGLTMYLAQTDIQQIFRVISGRFQDATAFVETMNPMVVRRFQEKSIAASGARFTWGVKDGETLAALLPDFRFMEEHGLTEGMAVFVPIYKLLDKIPAVRSISNRIVVLQQEGA